MVDVSHSSRDSEEEKRDDKKNERGEEQTEKTWEPSCIPFSGRGGPIYHDRK